jgi:hypothetical protein
MAKHAREITYQKTFSYGIYCVGKKNASACWRLVTVISKWRPVGEQGRLCS